MLGPVPTQQMTQSRASLVPQNNFHLPWTSHHIPFKAQHKDFESEGFTKSGLFLSLVNSICCEDLSDLVCAKRRFRINIIHV